MRDCFFLVADINMREVIRAFFGRNEWHRVVGCRKFVFDPEQDIRHAAGLNDPGLYTRGHEIARALRSTHRNIVVLLDAEWDGSPPRREIESHMLSNLVNVGWSSESAAIIVIEPELESWIWVDSPHVAKALGFTNPGDPRIWLGAQGLWAEGATKPSDPKGAVELALEYTGKSRSSSRYRQVIAQASLSRCTDAAFIRLKETLQRWFPPEDLKAGVNS